MLGIRLSFLASVLLITPFAFADDQAQVQVAVEKSCKDGLTQQVSDAASLLNELVQLAASGEKSAKFEELFKAYRTASGLSDADIHEAISMQVQLLQAEANRPGEGLLTEEDEKEAVEAYRFARQNTLALQAAMMAAVKVGNLPVVRGLLIIWRQKINVCKGEAGYSRYGKTLDLSAGWKDENFLLEAAKISKEIGLLLIGEGLSVPLASLNGLAFGTDLALVLIENGSTQPFSETIPMKDETISLKLLEQGQQISAADFDLAIWHHKNTIVKEALRLNPQLATIPSSDELFPLKTASRAANEEIVELLLKTYHVDPNQQDKSGLTALFAAVDLYSTKIFEDLLEAGANFNHVSPKGWTPLHAAIVSYKKSAAITFVSELILAGANVNAIYDGDLSMENPSSSSNWGLGHKKWTSFHIIEMVCGVTAETKYKAILDVVRNNGGHR